MILGYRRGALPQASEFALGTSRNEIVASTAHGWCRVRRLMSIFDEDARPALHIPDMTPAATARVGSDGTVLCVACQKRLPLAQADVVGQGYRCPQCSTKAEVMKLGRGATDVGDHLSVANREDLRKRGLLYLGVGGAVLLFGLALLLTIPLVEKGILRHPGVYVTLFGIVVLAVGSHRYGASIGKGD
jgi:hypothetical protein